MKLSDCKIGMKVRGTNMFGLQYTITKVNGRTVEVEYRDGSTTMTGGKQVPEVFTYKVRPSVLTEVKE